MFFIEDANEKHNVFDMNLGVFALQHDLLGSDSEPVQRKTMIKPQI